MPFRPLTMPRPRPAHPTLAATLRLFAVVASVYGCASTTGRGSLAYTPPKHGLTPVVAGSLAVVPFRDARDTRDAPPDPRDILLVFVPMVPYATPLSDARIDERYVSGLRQRGGDASTADLFPTTMAQAVAADLGASGLFKSATFTTAPVDADYVLGGTIRSTRYEGTVTTYLIGMPGMLLWFTGVPYGRIDAEVAIDLVLHDRSGAVVWQYPLRATSGAFLTALNLRGSEIGTGVDQVRIPRYGRNDKGIDGESPWAYHADALRTGMIEAKASLAARMAQTGG